MAIQKFISWNVNGIRACLKNGFKNIFSFFPDGLFLQEIKADNKTFPSELLNIEGYTLFINPASKKGYAGTAAYVRNAPIEYRTGLESPEFDSEGRVQIFEFEKFYMFNVYFPNSQHGLVRLDYKLAFNAKLLDYMDNLRVKKPIILTGDFNVAHKPIDLKNPESNKLNPGFTVEERQWFDLLLSHGYVDTFRIFTREGGHYSWWSYRFHARERNIGWRIDYFVVSSELKDYVKSSVILADIKGSDHAPVMLSVDIPL